MVSCFSSDVGCSQGTLEIIVRELILYTFSSMDWLHWLLRLLLYGRLYYFVILFDSLLLVCIMASFAIYCCRVSRNIYFSNRFVNYLLLMPFAVPRLLPILLPFTTLSWCWLLYVWISSLLLV